MTEQQLSPSPPGGGAAPSIAPPVGPFDCVTDTRARILHEAAQLFSERGFDAPSVREICEASGVSKPTLYYHFGNRDGVVEAVLAQIESGFSAMCSWHLAQTQPSVAGLTGLFTAFFEVGAQQRWLIKLLSRFPTVPTRFMSGMPHPKQAEAALVSYVAAAAEDAALDVDAEATVWLLIGAFTRLSMLRLHFDFDETSDVLARRLVHQALGLASSDIATAKEMTR